MQVSVESPSTLKRRVRVDIPSERLATALDERYKSLSRTAKVNGFRPGKVPVRVLKQKYGAQVEQEIVGKIVEDSLREALQQEKLTPVSMPEVDFNSDINRLSEDGLAYTADFEIYPQIEALNTEGIHVEIPVSEVTDADIDRMIETLRNQRKTWEIVERPAQDKDRVKMDVMPHDENGQMTDLTIEALPFVIGDNSLPIPELNDHSLGMSAGEEKSFETTFPEEGPHNEQFLGKTIQFKLHLHEVLEARLPEIDAAFIQSFGVEDGLIESFRKDIQENLERELKAATKRRIKEQLMESLLEKNPLELPAAMVAHEIKRLRDETLKRLESQGIADNTGYFQDDSLFMDKAQRNMRLGLLMNQVSEKQNITADPDRVRRLIEEEAETYENPQEIIAWYYAGENRGHMQQIESLAVEDQIVDWLLSQSEQTEVPIEFDALLNRTEQPPRTEEASQANE